MRRRTVLGLGSAAVPAAMLGHHPGAKRRWRHTWTAMPQLTEPHNMPPAPFTTPGSTLVDTTLRQTVHVTVGGAKLRVRFSNAFGGSALALTGVAVGLPAGGRAGVAAASSLRPLTFGGRSSVVVPVGAQIVSDPVVFPLPAGANLTISTYLASGQTGTALTGHPGSRTTSYLVNGDAHRAPDLPGATSTDHWYLISGVEVESAADGLVIVGDSLTDGRGSTTNGNDRWPDQLFALRPRTAILNQAAGGNRVLNDGLGPSVLARLDRDVLALSGADRLLIFEGVNDIGTAAATETAQRQVTDDLLVAFRQIALRAHAVDIPAFGATITPFGGNEGYDDPGGLRERSRQEVNAGLRRIFDRVLDFDAAVRDPAVPRRLLPAYDTGDHLHMNPAGYGALARAAQVLA